MLINEAGMYQLIFKSRLEKAQEFQDFVFSEVLPSIRKTGSFQIPKLYNNQFLMLNSNTLNTNYTISDFQENNNQEYNNLEHQYSEKLFLYSNKKRWFPMIKPASTVTLEKKRSLFKFFSL